MKGPSKVLGECISTVVFLINRVPSPALKDKSPYELLYHKLPPYEHFRVFGCLAYAVVPPHQRNKLSPRATPIVFMGYPIGYKGYKLFDTATNKFIISRDVQFLI